MKENLINEALKKSNDIPDDVGEDALPDFKELSKEEYNKL